MKAILAWQDAGLPERDGQKASVNDMAVSPTGELLVVAASNAVLVYDVATGDLRNRLRGHKDTVYTVSFSHDGERFASGGLDKQVIIWTKKGEGILKYTHSDSIQRVCYSPTAEQLASCTATDFGLWSKSAKSVSKHKVYSKILSAEWNADGNLLALGLFNGHISIRDKTGEEKNLIERDSPIWCLSWSPSRDDVYNLLAVGCWDQTLSFYQLPSGVQHFKERKLYFYPCCISWFASGEYIVVGGSDKRASLCTKEGVRLCTVADLDAWAWSTAVRASTSAVRARGGNNVAVGSYGGSIAMYKLQFVTVHGLYGDRYAYREHMTDVIVQHLLTEKRVRIKCRDYVKKIAVYRDRLAVQLPDKINIYELTKAENGKGGLGADGEESIDMHYHIRKEKIYTSAPCQLLVVTHAHVVLCNETKLQMYSFGNVKVREWVLESAVKYIKVNGGPPGREGLLVGLKNGAVLKVYVDNPFPIELIRTTNAVKCLDISTSRSKLALVDSESRVLVYDLKTKEVVFQEAGAQSVCFNDEIEDMLCFSTPGVVNIRTGSFPAHPHKLQGLVVGFKGSKIFSLEGAAVEAVDVPQSVSMYRYIEANNFGNACRVASLGVTESDWRHLGARAAEKMDLETARRAFMRVRDMAYIELLNSLEAKRGSAGLGGAAERKKRGADAKGAAAEEARLEDEMKAQLLAYNGQYQEAAKAFSRAGQPERAIELFADLRDWEQAKIYAGGTDKVDTRDLVRRQAEWAEEVKDWRGAADMFNTSGEHERAVRIIGENQYEGWDEQLIGIVRNLPNSDKTALSLAAEYLANGQSDAFAREAFEKLQDYTKLMALYIKRQDWEAAVKLSENHAGKFDQSIFLPYAEWLTLRDRYEEALTVYRKAGRPDRSHHIMKQLTYNAVVERRFKDAAYYYWLLAQESLHVADMSKEPITADQVKEQAAYLLKADVCYVYQNIEDFFLPFTSLQPEVLFQSARFLLNALGTSDAPHGVSRVKILCTLAKMAKQLGAFKLAQTVYHQLQHLKLPEAWQEQVDIDTLTIQAKSTFSDSQELLPICYRCGTSNPLLNPFTSAFSHGDVCTNCGHPFVRSFVTLDILPLVEFVPADTDASGKDLTDEVAVQLLRMAPDASGKPRKGKGRNWSEGTSGGANVMTLDDDGDGGGAMGGMGGGGGGGGGEDVFQKAVQQTLDRQQGASSYRPVLCDEDTLSQMRREEVFVIHSTHKGLRSRFYKNVLEGVPVALSQPAQRFFHEEELEAAILKDGKCPYSRAAVAGADYGSL